MSFCPHRSLSGAGQHQGATIHAGATAVRNTRNVISIRMSTKAGRVPAKTSLPRAGTPSLPACGGISANFLARRSRDARCNRRSSNSSAMDRRTTKRNSPRRPDKFTTDSPQAWARQSLEEFLARHHGLTARERTMAEAWSRSFFGLYEVQQPKAGTGVELKDLIAGETFFVHDINMSTRLVKWDGLLARVVPGERGNELTGAALTVPRTQLQRFREWMDDDREASGLEWREYLKGNWPRIRRQTFDIAANRLQSLQLANPGRRGYPCFRKQPSPYKTTMRYSEHWELVPRSMMYPARMNPEHPSFGWMNRTPCSETFAWETAFWCSILTSRARMERGEGADCRARRQLPPPLAR